MTSRLDGRTALVTGSTSGIGRATASALARRGAHVIVSGRDHSRGLDAVEAVRAAGSTAAFIAADLTSRAGARSLAERARDVTGRVDILVNNAGIFTFGPTTSRAESDIDDLYGVNLKAPFFLVQELVPQMVERGGGAVVNVLTGAAHRGSTAAGLYGSSKAALLLLTKAWAAEFGPSGVRVNAVSPGMIRTEGTDDGAGLDSIAATIPSRRIGDPHEVAAAVAFLASEEASYIHGAVLPVDGGATAA
ncbi:NAD(P)-dependent dehydrogenase, short-chain alcohol dehydrogenase family [Lentzea xinjiangensis]|uniref:NAD(P)-dependent dehydrogenase, short-chain alcohol dehydrogenase family n=1 Tax=Lentzea xinjiangensis TaxID=402600 RepID=A0A1H9W2Q4_9PSEU|nr:SDR family oxidoreductase [Lentzea xinjiangensis]SES28185.1 NAD(P)-dependent dehydrogenase, short-chain alcohol dehydrogenase family [Lentzea xinjiangensis]